MIDRKGRWKAAELLSDLLNGRLTIDKIDGESVGMPLQRDHAVSSALEYAFRVSRWLSQEHYCDYATCTEMCESCSRFAPGSDQRKTGNAKRTVARSILFLNTKQQYVWSKPPRMKWWMILLLGPALIVGIALASIVALEVSLVLPIYGVADYAWVFFICVALLAFLLLVITERLSRKVYRMDRRYWPFAGRAEYESAQANLDNS